MNIVMATNTFLPHVGGVARSVSAFTAEFRKLGHRVIVLAPEFDGAPAQEDDVIRYPALQRYNGSDFSIPMPVPGRVKNALGGLRVDVVHAHHPFLLGDMALRIGAAEGAPVVFTHHTMYEHYTHYVRSDSQRLKRFAIELVSGYCNLCDAVIAPSETVARLLSERGVRTPVTVIPTGIDVERFASGDRAGFRAAMGIGDDAFVVGHVGRLAPEKNLEFLTEAIVRYLRRSPRAFFLVAGSGALEPQMSARFASEALDGRVRRAGVLGWSELAGAYRAMDLFAFASKTETQGLVVTEAMAAGLPVVALDASGVREVVRDGVNGVLLFDDDPSRFADELLGLEASPALRQRMSGEAAGTAATLSISATAARTLGLYESLVAAGATSKSIDDSAWSRARRMFDEELKIFGNIAHALGDVVLSPGGSGGSTGR